MEKIKVFLWGLYALRAAPIFAIYAVAPYLFNFSSYTGIIWFLVPIFMSFCLLVYKIGKYEIWKRDNK